MKRYKTLLIIMVCIILSGLSVSLFILPEQRRSGEDTVLLNDIARTAQENSDDIGKMGEYDFGAEYIIFDPEGRAVYESSASDIKFLSDAVNKRYPHMTLTENGKTVISAAIAENQEEIYAGQIRNALTAVAVSGISVFLCMILWGVYVNKNIVKPFRKMERFAGEVAAGNLDAPLEMEKENMFGVFTESFDIMREELEKSRKREAELKRREKELIASLSHDLKTPVTGIKLTAELMLAQTDDPASREKLDNIYKKAGQIDALTNDLFASALKDLGEMKVRAEDEDSGILHEFVVRYDDKKLVSETEPPECIISIDRRRMEQIIGNIITNSYKYADTPIDISYSVIEGYLKMSIRDYGCGVPEDELPLVTNKFYRSRTHSGVRTDGSGLGLYIAKTLIENMNGEIRCFNREPGFEVCLLIPLS